MEKLKTEFKSVESANKSLKAKAVNTIITCAENLDECKKKVDEEKAWLENRLREAEEEARLHRQTVDNMTAAVLKNEETLKRLKEQEACSCVLS